MYTRYRQPHKGMLPHHRFLQGQHPVRTAWRSIFAHIRNRLHNSYVIMCLAGKPLRIDRMENIINHSLFINSILQIWGIRFFFVLTISYKYTLSSDACIIFQNQETPPVQHRRLCSSLLKLLLLFLLRYSSNCHVSYYYHPQDME